MSISLMSAAFLAPVTAPQKLVLLALCDCANDQGECYPSVPLLQQKTSLSERGVQTATNALEAAGYLRREFRNGRSTVYWMTPTPAPHAPRTTCPPHRVPPAGGAPTPAPHAPPPPQEVHPTPAGGAPRTVIESSVEPSPKQSRVASPPTLPPTPPAFDGKNAETLNGRAIVPIAAGFELPQQWGFDAEALGFKPGDVLREAEKFRQYWTAGKGADKRRSVRGWRQSWSNWLGKAARDQR